MLRIFADRAKAPEAIVGHGDQGRWKDADRYTGEGRSLDAHPIFPVNSD